MTLTRDEIIEQCAKLLEPTDADREAVRPALKQRQAEIRALKSAPQSEQERWEAMVARINRIRKRCVKPDGTIWPTAIVECPEILGCLDDVEVALSATARPSILNQMSDDLESASDEVKQLKAQLAALSAARPQLVDTGTLPHWIWYGEDTNGSQVLNMNGEKKHPCQHRYDAQPVHTAVTEEREACAKICDERANGWRQRWKELHVIGAEQHCLDCEGLARKIRARDLKEQK
jgi:hypothetical protein